MGKKTQTYNEKQAMAQGWLLANDGAQICIQRYDEAPAKVRFASDEAAHLHVASLAYTGDAHAAFCISQCTVQPTHAHHFCGGTRLGRLKGTRFYPADGAAAYRVSPSVVVEVLRG